ncbi:sensor domain-containing diguanylate cyclase [Thalassospira alkalitolerans]|mgnify:CR=1 FL=1|uniref:sensor domain-containing diguanylate cyclase n=1 Tax=Thalassospira alkalitolerans TaxID=1293890 RepID=UPI000A1FABD8|nr:sensor domain-containing diguanylate cyclase [Thalassospira alkalitolerans]
MKSLSGVGIRIQIALATAVLVVALAGAMSYVIGQRSTNDLMKQIGTGMSDIALQMADELDRTMWTHRGEVAVLSTLRALRNLDDIDQVNVLISRLQHELSIFTWIGVLDAEGNVVAATGDILLGKNISARPIYQYGSKEVFIGDVHDAKLLAKEFPTPTGEPLQFVDIAAPLLNDAGHFNGVLATHLSWEWANIVRRSLFSGLGLHRNVDIFVISANGTILLAPDIVMRGQTLELDIFDEARKSHVGWKIAEWPDGKDYLTGFGPADGHLDYAGLGWSVLARQNVETALTPVTELRTDILGVGLGLAALFSLIAWWGAGYVVGPLVKIAHAAGQLKRGEIDNLPDVTGAREINILSHSLRSLVIKLTEKDTALGEMKHIAHHDPLTGLGNRLALDVYLEHALAQANRQRSRLGILALDLDDFKLINDRLGHAAGDEVLCEVARRLRRCVRGGDLAARIGGDEMVIVAHLGDGGEQEVRVFAERILGDIVMPFITGGHRASINVSIGIGIYPEHAMSADTLLEKADQALYVAKSKGKHCYVIYGEEQRNQNSGSRA